MSGTFYASPHLRRITDLNLQGWGINGTAANLGTALRGMFGLFRLNMSLNALQGDLSAAFAQAPMGVAELQHLDVSFNPGLTVANAGALPPLLRELMTFNMSGCPLNVSTGCRGPEHAHGAAGHLGLQTHLHTMYITLLMLIPGPAHMHTLCCCL